MRMILDIYKHLETPVSKVLEVKSIKEVAIQSKIINSLKLRVLKPTPAFAILWNKPHPSYDFFLSFFENN